MRSVIRSVMRSVMKKGARPGMTLGMRSGMRSGMLFAAALVLAGCGIPATGVVQAGDPATGVRPTAVLYFIADDQLVPVYREMTDPVHVNTAMELLLAGPDGRDRRRGLTTAFARMSTPTFSTDGDRVSVQLSPHSAPLVPIATRQLICTVAEARLSDAPDTVRTGVTVVVTRLNGWRAQGSSRDCSV
ncbi:hypothetical protein [Streptomyces sp. NRRL F-525]|uniref:hypothetical protein n=1 Tax=Streptomyces sp. NRRL F-525 TaxID=1463861 RepID=UPI00131D4BC4|nr:hypothetical protein [Streptomyces sp. NRRL F-525]